MAIVDREAVLMAERSSDSGTAATGAPSFSPARCACGRERPESIRAPLIDIAELARWLGTSSRHVRRLVEEQRVPYLKIGHYVRFDPVEISNWIEGQRVPMASTVDAGDDLPPWVRLSGSERHVQASSASRPLLVPIEGVGKTEEPLWLRNRDPKER